VAWAVTVGACLPPDPAPIFLGSLDGGQAGSTECSDQRASSDCTATSCAGETYPCGPYGNGACELIRELSFQPVNGAAEDLAGLQGRLSLAHYYQDQGTVGLLLFATAGWCTFCAEEAAWLNSVYDDYRNAQGDQGIEFLAVVFQDDYGAPATADYARRYASRYGFPFAAVADTNGDILQYIDAGSAPGNIFLDVTTMRIQRVVQGYDLPIMEGLLGTLDGQGICR
jgi:thiol-disulfide isomerase/thioredoxin